MKNWLSFRAALALSLMASSLAFTLPAHAEKRVALVIGNNDYKNVPKLQKAVNDARTMGDTLKQLGFFRDNRGEPDPTGVSQPYLRLAPSTQFVSVELTYRDGSVSEIKSFRR